MTTIREKIMAEEMLIVAMKIAVAEGVFPKFASEEKYLDNWRKHKAIFAAATDIAEAEIARLEEVIDRLRGQLQNCVDHLEHARRKQYSRNNPYDKVIEEANRALYETLSSE